MRGLVVYLVCVEEIIFDFTVEKRLQEDFSSEGDGEEWADLGNRVYRV